MISYLWKLLGFLHNTENSKQPALYHQKSSCSFEKRQLSANKWLNSHIHSLTHTYLCLTTGCLAERVYVVWNEGEKKLNTNTSETDFFRDVLVKTPLLSLIKLYHAPVARDGYVGCCIVELYFFCFSVWKSSDIDSTVNPYRAIHCRKDKHSSMWSKDMWTCRAKKQFRIAIPKHTTMNS